MDISSNLEQTVFLYSFDWKENKDNQVIDWIKSFFSSNPFIEELPNNGDETEIIVYSSEQGKDSFLKDFYDEEKQEQVLNHTERFLRG